MSQQSPSFAKVTPPISAGVFPRKRLFEVLERLREKPIVWMSGPAGCGKTLLVSSYIEARNLACLWYEMDESDKDAASFFYYMGLAAKRASLGKGKPLSLLTPEYLPDLSTFTLRYFENLYDLIEIPSVLVLDNYQLVPAESPVHGVICNGLSRIRDGVNAIVISRGEPPPAFARMRASHLMEVIGRKQLRLTLKEARGITKLRTRKKPSEKMIRHLHTSSDGWAAGLVLILDRVKTEGVYPEQFNKQTPEEVFDYLENEVFDHQTSEAKEFLLKTAVFPKMSEKMAEKFTSCGFTGRILSNLIHDNDFTEKCPGTEPVYQYHPLFRQFLLSRARRILPAETLSVLRTHAAKLLEDAGETEEAVGFLKEAAEWETMASLLLRKAPSMLQQGRNRLLEEWLGSLPEGMIKSNPWLSYWMGACRLPFDTSKSRHFFEQAFERFKTREDAAGMFLAWCGVADAILHSWEDWRLFDQWIKVLKELMRDYEACPSEEIQGRVACSMCGALVTIQPHHPEVEAWLERAMALSENNITMNTQGQILFLVSHYYIWTGNLEKVASAIDSLRELTCSRDVTPLVRITLLLGQAVYFWHIGLYDRCFKSLSDGLELSRTTGIHLYDHLLLGNMAYAALNAGNHTMAAELLDRMALSLDTLKRHDKNFYYYLRATEALYEGDLREALHHSESSLRSTAKLGFPVGLALAHLLKAQVMHEFGKHEEAADHLGSALHIGRQMKSKTIILRAYLSEAQFALDQGKEASGLASLQRALTVGKEIGYIFPEQPSVTARLCAKALEAGIEVDYVQDVIKKRNIIPDEPPLHLENWPWALKVFTLGRFTLLKDGKPVRFSRKAQKRPLSMLKALIAFGSRQVTEEKIADALWPEADGDLAHQSFSTTLHRLRHLLGYEQAVQRTQGRLTLDKAYWWVDVWAFERLLGQADVCWEKGRADSAVRFMRKAIDMYKGPFLAREPGEPWIIPLRERVRSKLLRNVCKLGNHWQQVGEWEKALDYYKRGLEVDNLSEELYQCLMICYHELDRRADAVATYKKCKKILSSFLCVEPSPMTEAIYKAVLSKRGAFVTTFPKRFTHP